MFALRLRSLRLLVFCLVVLAASSTATAKKPVDPPDYPDPPVVLDVKWLPDLVDDSEYLTIAHDISEDGVIVGQSNGQAVCWLPPPYDYAITDLNDVVPDSLTGFLHLYSAWRITNNGLIAGRYLDADGLRGLFLYDMNGDPEDPEGSFFYSAPGVEGGGVWILGLNAAGTVVGYVSFPGPHFATYIGFVWQPGLDSHQVLPVKLLPEPFIPTNITNSELVVGQADDRSYNYGVFEWQLDFEDPSTVVNNFQLIGLSTSRFPGPQINSEGDIVAKIYWKEKSYRGVSISLLESGAQDWEILVKAGTIRIWMNDQQQIACHGVDFDQGAIIAKDDGGNHSFWGLDNPKIIDDEDEAEWLLDRAVLEGVADSSAATVDGFSPVVGWHYNGRAFLLRPTVK